MTRGSETARGARPSLAATDFAGGGPAPRRFRSPALWLLLAVFALEFFLFDQFGARRHTGIYPRWDDQVQYLSDGYIAYELSRTGGFGAALKHTLLHPAAQGTLHDFGELIAFKVAGPSRSAALALNIFALMAWQLALFAGVARTSGSRPFAFAAALLPLALVGPWENIPGSAYDFRLDHLAMCALGATAALALLTGGFRARGASLIFGFAVGVTLLTRFLTGTFLLLIFAGLMGGLLWPGQTERGRRIANLLLAGVVALILAGPIMWICRERVLDYYWIGHFVGPESAVRDAHMNVPASLGFVFRQLGERHVGLFFDVLAVAGLIGFFALRGARRPSPPGLWPLSALFILAPALVFALHRQKSEVVLAMLVPGVVMLVVATWQTVAGDALVRRVWSARLAAALALAACGFFVQRQLRPAYDPGTLAQIRSVNTLADELFKRVTTTRVPEPGIAVDHINDALHAEVLRVIFYERHRVWLPIKMTLPTGVVAPTTDDVMERLARSYLAIVTDEPAPGGRYPYDEKLAALRPQIRAWCDANLQPVQRFTLFGRSMTLYQRPETPLAPRQP